MATRRGFGAVLLAVVVLVAGCGGDDDGGDSASGGGADRTTAAPGGEGDTEPAADPAGSVDCAALEEASKQLLGVQLLAQIRTPDSVETMKAGTVGNLDLDAMAAALEEMEVLSAHPSPLGDPGEAIAAYQTAVAEAQELFAAEPVTQEAIDAYNENIGTVGEFLGHQGPISGAMDEAGC